MLSKEWITNSIDIIVWLEYSHKFIAEKINTNSIKDKLHGHKTKEYKYNYRKNYRNNEI